MNRFIFFILFAFFASCPGFAQAPEVEPNNTYSTATKVLVPSEWVGTINPAGDVDYYRLVLPGGATLHATLTPPAGESQFLYIYNQAGRIVAQSTLSGGAVQEVYYTNPSPYGFYFYAVVRGPWGVFSPDDYTLDLAW